MSVNVSADYILTGMYVLLMAFSLISNGLLIYVGFRFKYLKSETNFLLVNLAVADLVVTTCCMPIQLNKAHTPPIWAFDEKLCKISSFLQGVAVSGSIFSICAMTMGRNLSIQNRYRLRCPGKKQAALSISIIWMLGILIYSPLIKITQVTKKTITEIQARNEVIFCTEVWPSQNVKAVYSVVTFTLVYAIPGLIITYCSTCINIRLRSMKIPGDMDESSYNKQQYNRLTKERMHVAKMLAIMAGIFAACWMPYTVMQLLLDTGAVPVNTFSNLLPYALFAGHAQSAINACTSCVMTRNYKSTVHMLICRIASCPCMKSSTESPNETNQHCEQQNRCNLQMAEFPIANIEVSQLEQTARPTLEADISQEHAQVHHPRSCHYGNEIEQESIV